MIKSKKELFYHYSPEEFETSEIIPSRVLLYFDFGTYQNAKLLNLAKSKEYTFIDNFMCPISGMMDNRWMLTTKPKSEDINFQVLSQTLDTMYQAKILEFMYWFTSGIKVRNKKLVTPANHKIIYFLIENNIKFDLIFPTRNLKDWVLNEYLESGYQTEYLKLVFGEPESDLAGKMNFDNIIHLYYSIPQVLCNRIMITHPIDIDTAYYQYFNI